MINYADCKSINTSDARYIDTLTDIRSDVRGASFLLYASAECGMTIETEQLRVIADCLLLASDALDSVVAGMEYARRSTDEQLSAVCPDDDLPLGLIHVDLDTHLFEIDASEVPGAVYQGKIQFPSFDDAARYLANFHENQRRDARTFFGNDEHANDDAENVS